MLLPVLLAAATLVSVPDYSPPQGALNPAITQENIATTICIRGYTGTIRPPEQYTENLKRKQMRLRHLPGSMRLYQEDHFIPLGLGGNPTDPNNLWPEPRVGKIGALSKDRVETRLHFSVCKGKITLQQARQVIISNYGKK